MNREESLFEKALELPSGERAAFLQRECADDVALRSRVEVLLEAHSASGDFMGRSASPIPPPPAAKIPEEKPGDRIGRYKLLQKIGEGGCGVVYMAEQEEPVHRRVALKVVKLGMDTKAVVTRFEAERQALALMDHPNIAHVFDGGATDQGRPFFVMELVRGVRITDYCNQNRLPIRDRLGLFLQVCGAIQHAHQKGIIHRDIKPSNILVALNDGEPVPKVIDFGIAKATQGRLTEGTLFTAWEQVMGTPAYMSPEQVDLGSEDVDTRTDIYSLGVLLYELLTGRPPFDAKTLSSAGVDRMRQTIREVDPPKPSTRVRTLSDADRSTVARERSSGANQLLSALRGDLNWIVMKALEKARSRRYDTVNGLAADIRRHLANETVTARPPTVTYRLGRLIRRNRFAAASIGVIALMLVAGIAVTYTLMRRAQDAQAQQEVWLNLFNDDFDNITVLTAIEGDTEPLGLFLEQRAASYETILQDQPILRATALERLGGMELAIGKLDFAERMYTDALALRREYLGAEDPSVAVSLHYLGLVQSAADKVEEAEVNLREAIALQEREPPSGSRVELARTQSTLGWVLMQRRQLDGAEASLQSAIASQRVWGTDRADLALSLKRLGFVHILQHRLPDAEHELTEAKDMNLRVLGEDHLEVASSLNFLAVAYAAQPFTDGGPEKMARAIGLYKDAIAIREGLKSTTVALQSPEALLAMLTQQGTPTEVLTMIRMVRENEEERQPDDKRNIAYYYALSAVVMLEEEEYSQAVDAAQNCYALRYSWDREDWSTFHALAMWGAALAGSGGNPQDAEAKLLEGYNGMKDREDEIPGPHRLWLGMTLKHLVGFYQANNQPEKVAQWTKELVAWAQKYPNLASLIPQ